jgi:site-specific DNA recombinase
MTATSRSLVRCAIYTRKSSEEGLEQSFNSLHAQREACEAFIVSQRHEGWQVIPTQYDDGGFSGGNVQRPALKQLLEDIAARLVDTVVVYKVDRLTRSLMDFAKIIEVFDKQGVSFVSVTQQFNTTSSMGRLTLNVLLSFAQFEREVTGERIRDKIAASKKKGLWMGGVAVRGYDVEDGRLVLNPSEAKTVEEIFTQYLNLGSVGELKKYLDQRDIRTQVRTAANGRVYGGQLYSRGSLYKLLNNEVYGGRIAHRGASYVGQHPAIIPAETREKVRALLAVNTQGQRQGRTKTTPSVLSGLVFDADGNRYTPTHALKNGRRYRYYTSQAVIQKRKKTSYLDRIPAKELEQVVFTRIQTLLASPQELASAYTESALLVHDIGRLLAAAQKLSAGWPELTPEKTTELLDHTVRRIIVRASEVEIGLDLTALAACLLQERLEASAAEGRESHSGRNLLTLKCVFTIARRRGELRLALSGSDENNTRSSSTLVKAIVTAHGWRERIIAGEVYSTKQLARETKLNSSYVSRILRMAALSPDIVDAIIRDRLVADRSLMAVVTDLPLAWKRQLPWLKPA